MKGTAVRHLIWDFLEWSGGSPPESEFQITVYADYACPQNVDSTRAWQILNIWMARQGLSRVEKAKYGLHDVRGDVNKIQHDSI